jgi:hypothetical protein
MAPRQARFCSFQAIVREWASDVAGDLDNATRVAPGDGLDRLAPAREAAQIAAALRRRFSHELISAIAAMPQEKLDDALTQLVNAEVGLLGTDNM